MTIKCRLCDKPATHIFHCDEHYCCEDCGTRADLCTYSEGVLCSPCHEKRVEKRIAEFNGDTDNTDEVICAHCGYKYSDRWEISEGVRECEDCGREFEISRDVTVRYSTTKMPNAEVSRDER